MDFAEWIISYQEDKQRSLKNRLKDPEENLKKVLKSQEELQKAYKKTLRNLKIAPKIGVTTSNLEKQKESQESDLKWYENKVVELQKRIKSLKALIVDNIDSKTLYKKLMKHPDIVSLEVNEAGDLIITTKVLRGQGTNLGAYKIVLSKEGFGISIENLTWECDDYDHPHICNGNPCLGTYEDGFRTYNQTGELFLLIDGLIYYLKDYCDDNPYIDLESWISERTARRKREED